MSIQNHMFHHMLQKDLHLATRWPTGSNSVTEKVRVTATGSDSVTDFGSATGLDSRWETDWLTD